MALHTVQPRRYGFEVEMIHKALAVGARATEIPVRFTDRVEETSKMSLGTVGEAFALVPRLLIQQRLGSRVRQARTIETLAADPAVRP
jgi:hypothetical protein